MPFGPANSGLFLTASPRCRAGLPTRISRWRSAALRADTLDLQHARTDRPPALLAQCLDLPAAGPEVVSRAAVITAAGMEAPVQVQASRWKRDRVRIVNVRRAGKAQRDCPKGRSAKFARRPPPHDFIPKLHASSAQSNNLGRKILHDQVDAVPTPGSRLDRSGVALGKHGHIISRASGFILVARLTAGSGNRLPLRPKQVLRQ
jgi:hypothetical protein